ncbi:MULTISPECIES: MarR family winged helix-turn-helix transcriptional regulator [Vibrio]|uniref:HTH-type transcriptional regulator SarZ n=2 Tax=Vibrio casei TaxID=673372 RepID=A0A368LJ46_9VIBR|nr:MULTISPECIES: MarR family transcriptional regulator [Vibrio]RCS70655.1 MarR family transcriptional regulator [Vibrio casei]SJN27039.1 Organic hydroperoxide resistance transcriptional regulator [Vibrio casei]HBV76392.1 MarR family transcriptional regulator [Vibrio sp.]
MKHPQLKLDNQICHRLYMASNALTRTYREMLSELDLTYPQYVVMMALWEQDNISITKLLEKTAIDGSAMTQILKKMSDKGLLNIIKDGKDNRKRLVTLQDDGKKIQNKAASIPQSIRCQFPSLSHEDSEKLIHLLDKVIHDAESVKRP